MESEFRPWRCAPRRIATVRYRKTGRRIFLNRFKEPRLNTASSDVVELAKALVEEMAVVMLAVQASTLLNAAVLNHIMQ